MKEQAEKTTLYKKGGIGKSLRLIITGALVATFFNCSLMAYADEGDPGDGNGGSAVEKVVPNTPESGQENTPVPQNAPKENPFDYFNQFAGNITDEMKSVSDHFVCPGDDTYKGIHVSFNANAGTDEVTNMPSQIESDYQVKIETVTDKREFESDGWMGNYESYMPYAYYVDKEGNLYKQSLKGTWEYDDESEKYIFTPEGDGNYQWNDPVKVADKGDFRVTDDGFLLGKHSSSGDDNSKNHIVIPKGSDPIREGYDFVGWSTNPNATEGEFHAGEKVAQFFCQNLYAIWRSLFPETPLPPVTPEPDEPEGFAPIVPGFTVPSDPTPPADGGNGGGGVRVAPLTSLGDDGTPMGVFDTGHGIYCWVHWWILLGTLITVAMSVLVLNRRERYISKLNKVERDILEERTGATVADPSFVPVGVSA